MRRLILTVFAGVVLVVVGNAQAQDGWSLEPESVSMYHGGEAFLSQGVYSVTCETGQVRWVDGVPRMPHTRHVVELPDGQWHIWCEGGSISSIETPANS